MRELTVEEMEQVAGGFIIVPTGPMLHILIEKLMDHLWENREEYLRFIAIYGSGASNSQLAAHFAANSF